MKKYMLCLICILMFLPCNGFPQMMEDEEIQKGTEAAWRSFILSGWGQFYNDQKLKGLVAGTVTYTFLAGGITLYLLAEKDYSDYEKKGVADDPLYDSYKKKIILADACFGLSAAGWIYSIIDAYVVGNKNREAAVSKNSTVKFFVDSGQCKMDYQYSF